MLTPVPIDIGTVLGDWRIDVQVGVGGMGAVYSATHTGIGKRAAIKVVRAELCEDAPTRERFLQEARLVNQIGHPGIVDIFHVGTLDDGRPYLVMELLEGCTLSRRMAEGRVLANEAIDILLQVCDALEAAHSAGVVHRDLKPDNIFLRDGDGGLAVKLVDFGIAKPMDVVRDGGGLTTTGTLVGTPQYMSPEQARGKPVDGRTDIYALGAIAFELFLEDAPFHADNVADLVTMQLRATPPTPSEIWPDIPPALEALLLAMLAKRPAERPSLAEVQRTLRELRVEIGSRRRMPRRRPAVLVAPPLDGARTWGMAATALSAAPAPRRQSFAEAFGALAAFLMLAAACATVTEMVGEPATLLDPTQAVVAPVTAAPALAPPPTALPPTPSVAAPEKKARARRPHRPERRRVVRLDPDGTIDPFE